MKNSPYTNLPSEAFWKTGVSQCSPYAMSAIYRKKYSISRETKIATAGSCFAQHISRNLVKNGFNLLDLEPPPLGLPTDLHLNYGFSMYSARYGNIYTVRQLHQLAKEAVGTYEPQDIAWPKGDTYIDAIRPAIEPNGYSSVAELLSARSCHLAKVKQMLLEMDLFIFTLGLTEMWIHSSSGTVYPLAPGSIGGDYDPSIHQFENASFSSIIEDYYGFESVVRALRGGRPFQVMLTVSPVPLTATAVNQHVLVSTTHSKSTLRAVAGELSKHDHIDYFPSYELVVNPRLHSTSYSDNLRTVRDEAVSNVMSHFFAEHKPIPKPTASSSIKSPEVERVQSDVQCEEALLEAFGQ
jgi:hypothetical protein